MRIDEDPAARIRHLEETLMAPCCYQEPLLNHRSEAALQMKAEIAAWVAQGKSDREIVDAYKTRYGPRILVDPEGASWWWLTVMPWAALLLGAVAVIAVLWRWRRAPTPAG